MPDNRIADFHNDILTASGRIEMLSRETVCCVCALFRGNRSFAQLRSIALRFNKEKRRNLFLGLEDIGYFTPETAEEGGMRYLHRLRPSEQEELCRSAGMRAVPDC